MTSVCLSFNVDIRLTNINSRSHIRQRFFFGAERFIFVNFNIVIIMTICLLNSCLPPSQVRSWCLGKYSSFCRVMALSTGMGQFYCKLKASPRAHSCAPPSSSDEHEKHFSPQDIFSLQYFEQLQNLFQHVRERDGATWKILSRRKTHPKSCEENLC